MQDLFSIDEIKPIKDDIRCRTCLMFNTILHASDVWILESDEFKRMDLKPIKTCHLIEKLFVGSTLRDDDYALIDACELYEEMIEWDGMNRAFIKIINAIIDYVILTDNRQISRELVIEIAKSLDNSYVANTPNEEEKNVNIREQFVVERDNFELMEDVRRLSNDT